MSVVVVGGASPHAACAQVEKTFQRTTMNGRTVQTPYVTRSELQDIRLGTPCGAVRLGEIMTVVSIEEAARLLGEPDRIDRNVFPDGERFVATLKYKGMMLKYVKRKDGRVRLNTIEIRSHEWTLKVGGVALRPGMNINRLSPTVRKSIDEDTFLGEKGIDGVAAIRVSKPERKSKGQSREMTDDRAQITIHVNKDKGTVEVIRFHRIV